MSDIPEETLDRRAEDPRLSRLETRVNELADDIGRVVEILDKAEAAFEFFNWAIDKLKNGITRLSEWVKPIAIIVTGCITAYHAITGNLKAAATWLIDLIK